MSIQYRATVGKDSMCRRVDESPWENRSNSIAGELRQSRRGERRRARRDSWTGENELKEGRKEGRRRQQNKATNVCKNVNSDTWMCANVKSYTFSDLVTPIAQWVRVRWQCYCRLFSDFNEKKKEVSTTGNRRFGSLTGRKHVVIVISIECRQFDTIFFFIIMSPCAMGSLISTKVF